MLGVLLVAVGATGQTRGPIRLDVGTARIALLDRATRDTLRFAQVGDTITVDVLVNAGKSRGLTGVQFYLAFDPGFLSPLDADPDSSGLQPVRSAGLIPRATVIANTFNTEDASRYRGILYAEGLLSGSGGPDSGRVGSIGFRLTKAIPPGGEVSVAVDPDTVVFRSSYQVQASPGQTFPLFPRSSLHLSALPPVLTLPGPLSMKADSSLVLPFSGLVSDPLFASRQLRWAVSARDSGVAVVVNEGSVTIVPSRTYAGSTTLIFVVTNPAGFSSRGEVPLQVGAPNRPPFISPDFPPEIRLVDGRSEALSLAQYISDPDVSIAVLRWAFSGQKEVTPSVSASAVLTLTAPTAWAGQERMTLTARDPEGAAASVTFSLVGTVSPLPGDFNADGTVDFGDFFAFAQAFGSDRGQPGFDPRYDMDASGRIDLEDFFRFAAGFGRGR